jgi:hypothetical protein
MMRDLRLARVGSPLQHQAQLEAIAALTAAERAHAEQHHVPDHGDMVPTRGHDPADDRDDSPGWPRSALIAVGLVPAGGGDCRAGGGLGQVPPRRVGLRGAG